MFHAKFPMYMAICLEGCWSVRLIIEAEAITSERHCLATISL